MNFGKAVRTMVAFIAFCLIWAFLSVCILPHMTGMIGIPSLYPHELWRAIYAVLQNAAYTVFVCILFLIAILYVVYNLINSLPGILKALIGWVWSPFPPFITSGIFPLIDSILETIFSNHSIKVRFQLIGNGFKNMFINGLVFLINDLAEYGIPQNALKRPEPAPHPVPNNTIPTNPIPVTDQSYSIINQKYNECLQENLINVTNSMSAGEVQLANVSNQTSLVKCKMNQFYNSIDILAQRAGAAVANAANK